MPTNILVVGGAGYIGSHMVIALKKSGFNPIVFDNLSTGHRENIVETPLIIGNMGDKNSLFSIFNTYQFEAIIHLASFIEVAESVANPRKYYQNNVVATLNLLECMLDYGIKHFIFSSSAAVYGEPTYSPIDELHPISPINPYGRSKAIIEQVLQDYVLSENFHYASLRYFNAAGADPSGKLCEQHHPESHLIPLVLQVAAGQRSHITVYGRDYPTQDKTCIRDYVHVNDLCQAHILALQTLLQGKKQAIYNLGTGSGYSVQQVIDIAQQVTGNDIVIREGQRRAGDPAILVANAALAKQELAWQPQYDLRAMIEHAWQAYKSVVLSADLRVF